MKIFAEKTVHITVKSTACTLYNLNSESAMKTSTEEHKRILHLQQIATTFTMAIMNVPLGET